MGHAITIGDVLMVSGIAIGLLAFGGLCLFVLWLINPFRSGH